jgi:hypothetical protein
MQSVLRKLHFRRNQRNATHARRKASQRPSRGTRSTCKRGNHRTSAMKQHVNCIKYTAQHDGTIPSASVQHRTERGRETSTHNDPLYEFQRSSVNAVRTGILLRTLMTRRKTTKQMKDTHGWSRQRREWRGCVVVVVTMEHLEVYARHYVNTLQNVREKYVFIF